jgi:hypothetical protein
MADNALIKTLQQVGFRGRGLRDAWAIAQRESGGQADAFNGNAGTGDQSYGLFQVNMLGNLGPARRKQFGLSSNEQLLDPMTNARVAYEMSKGGTDFGAWGVGKNAYRKTAPLDYSGFPGSVPVASTTPTSSGARAGAVTPGSTGTDHSSALSLIASLLGSNTRDSTDPLQLLTALASKRQSDPPERQVPRKMMSGGQQAVAPKRALALPLQWSGTHNTDGLTDAGRNTAIDLMAKPGTPVTAPFGGRVERLGSAQGGQSAYLRANDGQRYWLGHVDRQLPAGRIFRPGEVIAFISADHDDPHAHWDRLP